MSETEIIQLVERYLQAKEQHKPKIQYNLNIIDELHANENAHTRILLKLLSYEQDGKKIVLENFITIMNSHITKDKDKISFSESSKILGQFYYMDGYIKSSDSWAVIIENKINWATDQETQIDRYIQTVINEGIPKDKIYAIYLTDDGSKKVWDGSFTKKENILGYVDENEPGRFIELNYRDDIMQLLNMTLKQLPPDRENILVSAITQYNDYLEGRFGTRKSEKEYNDAMNKSLIEILNLTGTKQEKFEAIGKLQQELWNRLDDAAKNEIIYPLPQLHDFLLQNSDKVAPFGNFIINWEELCMYSSVPSIPLSVEQNIYLAISIFFGSENDFYFRVHTLPWNDSFHEFLKEHKVLFDYLENDTRFTSFNVGYTTKGHFVDLNDLQEQVLKLYSEIRKCLS